MTIERTESKIRKEILEKVKEFYWLKNSKKVFAPGISKVNYAGRVFDEKEICAAVDSILDFWITLGKKGHEFISDFCAYQGMNFGLVANSGSSANLLAISALCSPHFKNHLQKGDEVITTASTFPTTLNPIIQNGLTPVFVDIESDTYNIDASKIENAISSKTRAIMLAHTLGNPAQMDVVMSIADKYDLFVVEDTCDGLDSKYDGKLCGCFGDISTYSFYAAHHITMGEGGALLTNNVDLYKQALSIRDWGRACFCDTGEANPNGACGHRFDMKFDNLPNGYDHKYIYTNIGYNLKPLDTPCAIGIEQLKKLPQFTIQRKLNFKILYKAFEKFQAYFILPRSLPKSDPSWFAIPFTIKEDAGFTRKDFITYMESKNIETRMLFCGNILKHPAYKELSYRIAGKLENTEKVMNNTFFLGVYPGLDDERLEYISSMVNNFFAT